MGRNIVVMSNCQTGGLHAALAAMLPDDQVTSLAWLGAEPAGLRPLLADADVWVCSIPRSQAEAIAADCGAAPRIVVVPTVWFPAFHPDHTPLLLRRGGELEGAVGPYHSKICAWGWTHGFSVDDVLSCFRPDVFAGLGYFDAWAPAVAELRGIFEPTDVDFAGWFLPLGRRGAFMLTNNHPRIDALVQLARSVAVLLDADPELVRYGWEQVLPDGLLASSVVWPLYPAVADVLDLPGAYVWRLASGELIDLPTFVGRCMDRYASLDPAEVDTDHLEVDPRFPATLGTSAPALVSGASGGR
ncbi:MAG: WcbI family polysaccharide biosynthesis putative acetyltransferase [Acidimicrobiales bacterium]